MKIPSKAGFTLVEILVALGLTGIVSLALMNNMKSSATTSKKAKQELVITTTTKTIETILHKAETTNGNTKNCSEIITPGGALAAGLAPTDFVANANLGDGVTLTSIDMSPEAVLAGENRQPITVTLNFDRTDDGRVIRDTRKIQTSVVNDDGIYKCFNYDGQKILTESLNDSCSVIDPAGDCSFADFTANFKISLNKIICEALGATNPSYTGNTICNSIDIQRYIHGSNVSLTGSFLLARDKVCAGAECRMRFDNTPCSANTYLASMDVSGDLKKCAPAIFNYVAP